MSREHFYIAVILKKQPFGEGDEIISVYTQQSGKLRFLAKSVKAQKSKLQQSLQALFLVRLKTAGGRLPKIISAEPVAVFANLRASLPATLAAIYACETVMKFTADEQPNQALFLALKNFLYFLDGKNLSEDSLNLGLAKFKINLLKALGLNVSVPAGARPAAVYFSNRHGGFCFHQESDSVPVSPECFLLFFGLAGRPEFEAALAAGSQAALAELQVLLSGFVEFQLEREVRSEKYLNQLRVL